MVQLDEIMKLKINTLSFSSYNEIKKYKLGLTIEEEKRNKDVEIVSSNFSTRVSNKTTKLSFTY